jgi:hypothetical protein
MPESLMQFAEPNLHKFGQPSYDWSTYILRRHRKDLDIWKHPGTIGVSVSVLKALKRRGCQLIIVTVDGIAKYKVSPDDWLTKSVIDQLTPTQEPDAFLPLRLFKEIRRFD